MAVSGQTFYMDDDNKEDFITLCGQLAGLINSASSDFEDILASGMINRWAKNKGFRYPAWNFASDAARDAARKEANQGLLLPTQKQAGVASSSTIYPYMNYAAYLAAQGTSQGYTYLRPRGVTSVYNEPNRLRDMDGYNHVAPQPFTTGVIAIYADGTQGNLGTTTSQELKEINRFLVKALRFYVQTNSNADFSIADLLYGANGTQFYLSAEIYKDTGRGNGYLFYERRPDSVYKSTKNIAQIPQQAGFDAIDIDLDAADDDKQMYGVVGFNKFTTASSTTPANEGVGFIAPWESTEKITSVYGFQQRYFGVLNGSAYQGYYVPVGGSSFTAFDVPSTTTKNTSSGTVALSIKLRRMNVDYYIVGSAQHSAPASAVKYMFQMIYAGPTSRVVIGEVVLDTITQKPGNGMAVIDATGDAEQVVYLRFDNLLASVGDNLQFAILQISADGGVTWDYVQNYNGQNWSSVGMYIKRTV